MSYSFHFLLVLALILGSLGRNAIAEPQPAPTAYGDDVSIQAWTCGDWGPWEYSTYCSESYLCSNYCPMKIRAWVRFRECCDEAGNCYSDADPHHEQWGCCDGGVGGQCPFPFIVGAEPE